MSCAQACDIYNRRRQERAAALAMAIVALVLIFVAALGIGRTAILPRVVLEILGQSLLAYLRLPRVVAAVVAGGALSVAEAAYQGLFRNPMVLPDILGASAGASFGAALGLLLGLRARVMQLCACLIGFVAVALTMALSRSLLCSTAQGPSLMIESRLPEAKMPILFQLQEMRKRPLLLSR